MRRTAHNGVVKPMIAGAQTVSWVGSELPPGTRKNAIAAHHVSMKGSAGAGNVLSSITRIRVKANGATIWDIGGAEYAAWIERFAAVTDFSPAPTARRFTLHYNDISQATNELADQSSCFPYDATPSVEFTFSSAAIAGSILISTTFTDIESQYYPELIGSQMNIGAGVSSGFYQFTNTGLVRGLMMPTVGIDRLRLVCSGVELYQGPGPCFGADAVNQYGDPILETQSSELYAVNYATTPWIEVGGIPAEFGTSNVNLVTHATAWAGVANELNVYAVKTQTNAKAA